MVSLGRHGPKTHLGPFWSHECPEEGRLAKKAVLTLSGPVLRDTARLSQQYPPIARYGFFREAPDTFNFLRHVMRAILSVRPKCSHRCVSLKETHLKRFRKGVGGKRGLAQGTSRTIDSGPFSAPFFLCPPMSRRTQF